MKLLPITPFALIALLFSCSAQAQQLDEQFDLQMIEEHQIEFFDYKDSTGVTQNWLPEYLKWEMHYDGDYFSELWELILQSSIQLKRFPYQIFDMPVDIYSIDEPVDLLKDLGEEVYIETLGVTEVRTIRPTLHSLLSIESWKFNPSSGELLKSVDAILPIKVEREIDHTTGQELDGIRREVIGMLTFEERIQRKNLKKTRRGKLAPLLSTRYAFELVDPQWYGILDTGFDYGAMEKAPSPYFKASTLQWNEYQAKLFLAELFEGVAEGNRAIYHPFTRDKVTLEEVYMGAYPEERQLMIDFEGEPMEMDLDRTLYRDILSERTGSVIFDESWYVDDMAMHITKKVHSITPVIWKLQWSPLEEIVTDEAGSPIYEKIPLYTIYFD